ncbi:MAG: CapA family protein, partial [Chloroflexi bacterium]|nr:CapA family protein [Chloroflexota bacterium]
MGQPRSRLRFMGRSFKVGDAPAFTYEANEDDVAGILRSVREGKQLSDFLILTQHAHEPGNWSREPADYLPTLVRSAIDEGADMFIGHGPHQLRGIEIYEGRPIFYSLGNFIFHDNLTPVPYAMFERYDVDPREGTEGDVNAAMGERFNNRPNFESVITVSTFEGGRVSEIRLYPIELRQENRLANRGVPRLAPPETADRILERLQELSAPFGTIIEIEALLPVGGEALALSEGVGPGGNPQVHVDWGNTGDFSGANDEITSDVREVSTIKTGRNFPSTLTGESVAGQMTVVLDNSSGDYSSLNPSAAEAGNIVMKRKVRVRMTSPFTRDFIMYLVTIIADPQLGKIPTATLTARGPIRNFTTTVSVALQKAKTTDLLVAEVLDELEFSAALRLLDTGKVTVTRWGPGPASGLSLIQGVENTEDGFFRETVDDGGIAFEDRDHRYRNPHQVSQATFSDSGAAEVIGYRDVTQEDAL